MSQHVIPYGRQSISDEDIQAVVVLKCDYLKLYKKGYCK
jgi:hypothetical protein